MTDACHNGSVKNEKGAGNLAAVLRPLFYYPNVLRGKRQTAGSDGTIPCILEPQGDEKTFKRNWARLIRKI